DRREIVARGLDEERRYALAEDVPRRPLDGGVAAAVQDESRLRADQAAAVGPEREILAPDRTVAGDELARVAVGPSVLHALPTPAAPGPAGRASAHRRLA